MYKNHQTANTEGIPPSEAPIETKAASRTAKEVSLTTLKDLLEKNLKWSQIIYEQNRRLNSKLFWTALASWFKVLVFIGALGWTVFVLKPLANSAINAYQHFLGGGSSSGGQYSSSSLQSILPLLPINEAQKEQLKALLK